MIDYGSPPGSWRRALNPEGPSCAVCSQNECGHSDPEFQGVVPELKSSASTVSPVRGAAAEAAALPLNVSSFHSSEVSRV